MESGMIEVRKRNQVTLPKSLATRLGIAEGDILDYIVEDNKIIITPKMLVPKDQAWFWTKEWQQAEREVAREIKTKGIGRPLSADELLKELGDA